MTRWAAILSLTGAALPQTVDFGREVRPILSENCFQCHGPDSGARQAGLRLDTREGLLAKAGVVTPGRAAESRLYQRISHAQPALRMPPPHSKKELRPAQVEALRRWIDQGAQWQEHWSFRTPERPPAPEVKLRGWERNPIDSFLLARLEQAGLQPEREADRRVLIRRLSLDLTGLPPSPAEVERFVSDQAANYYEKAVDRLLASPHWGEHRARYWLDAARYADTHGLHADNYRQIWPYRDWVIGAFNRNLPFDKFTIEQLAGDLLPDASTDQRIATGFHRCNITTNEAGSIPEEVAAIYARDRVETTGTVWLGLSLGCAACHDHKYDPVTQREFYRFSAFFMNTPQKPLDGNIPGTPPLLVIPRSEDQRQWKEASAQAEELRLKLKSRAEAAIGPFEIAAAVGPAALPLTLPEPLPEGVNRKEDGTLEFTKAAPIEMSGAPQLRLDKPFTLAARVKTPEAAQTVIASYVGSDGPGVRWVFANRAMFLHFILEDPASGRKLHAKAIGIRLSAGEPEHFGVTYDGSGQEGGITFYVGGVPVDSGDLHEAYDAWKRTPLESARFRVGGDGVNSLQGGAIGSVRVFDSELSALEMRLLAVQSRPAREEAPAAVDAAREKAAKDLANRRHLFLALNDPEYRSLSRQLEAAERTIRAIRQRSVTTLVMEEKKEPPSARILARGQYDQPGETVAAGIPAAVGRLQQQSPNRLALAQWLVSPANPLTARVTVNRFWQEIFGTGLVRTAEDFGATGEPPSHPELLDWLAVDFRETGWDVKRFFRMMVTSAAYRQSAAASEEKRKIDPGNRLISRGPRFRLDAETIRDAALASSGLLVRRVGGPSVKPQQPDGVWEGVAMLFSNTRFYQPDEGERLYRRSLYTFWKRFAPPPAMEIFNAPTRESCLVRRDRTNTPLQALAAMNDRLMMDASRRLAESAISEGGGGFDGRLDYMTGRILARPLDGVERASARAAHAKLQAHYRKAPEASKALARDAETATWTMMASILLNLDEALNK
jgi:hypothetical protein